MLWRWSVGDRISIAVVVCVVQSRGLALQVEQEVQRRNLMQGDIKNTSMDLNKAKSKEKQLAKVRTSGNIMWDRDTAREWVGFSGIAPKHCMSL